MEPPSETHCCKRKAPSSVTDTALHHHNSSWGGEMWKGSEWTDDQKDDAPDSSKWSEKAWWHGSTHDLKSDKWAASSWKSGTWHDDASVHREDQSSSTRSGTDEGDSEQKWDANAWWHSRDQSSNASTAEEEIDSEEELDRFSAALELLGGPVAKGEAQGRALQCGCWDYVVMDERRRSFAGLLKGAFCPDRASYFFQTVRDGTNWIQQESTDGPTPRRTAWFTEGQCQCNYAYSGDEVPRSGCWPSWMEELLGEVMSACSVSSRSQWPNSCNLNLYERGDHCVGWHSDNEPLFQGKYQDCRIISLSLGQARSFEMYALPTETGGEAAHCKVELASGDICTMEGMFQKHYWHRVPAEEDASGPRINLTWRWIVQHVESCPLSA